jgi:hypothetical protein
MSTLPLPSQSLARLQWWAESGDHEAKALLHLLDRADKHDQDVAVFVDSYSKTIAALCRRLEALERGATDLPAPIAPVDGSPVANALQQAEAALADVAKGEAVSPHAVGCLHWAEARCTEALAAIRPVMKKHGIQTSEFPPAVPAPAPAAPTPRPTALVEVIGNELPLLPGGKVDQVLTLAVIRKLAAWLDKQGDHFSGNCLRSHINR